MLPEQFTKRMEEMLGEEYPAFLQTFEREPYRALRLNLLKRDGQGNPPMESSLPFHLRPVPWAGEGYYYESEDAPGKHPYHEAGLYYIQEPSAMAPVTLLRVQPGEQILDLCAAPGGKSTQIASALKGQGLLICNEIHPARAKILSENIERMGVRNACVTNETPDRLSVFFPEYFDGILVDAPCSGEGMFRKNDVACEEWSPENVKACGERQDEILDCAAGMLRPGGRLVYSTCTFAPIENEGSISRFLERHPEFHIQPVDKEALQIEGDGVPAYVEHPAEGIENTVRLWPHEIQGEGHYAALLIKDGSVPEGYRGMAPGGYQQSVSQKELGEYPAFAKEFLKPSFEQAVSSSVFLKFGDQLYLLPEGMPNLKGLKVLRPGLHLGTLKKNRFEPSHALALALSPEDVVYCKNLSATDSLTQDYLNGQTFPDQGEKGWYLICVDGFSMGWGKLAGGIMKNHYPKGLRK